MSGISRQKYKENIEEVKENIKKACGRVRRDPSEILIIAASKYSDAEGISEVLDLGVKDFGENRAQDMLDKKESVTGDPRWHFIGHLQSNKVRKVVPVVDYIHSIDKISTIKEVDKVAGRLGKKQKVLIEVNLSGEGSKFGIKKEMLERFLKDCACFKNVCVCGLMTMAPYTQEEQILRDIFRSLKELKTAIMSDFDAPGFKELSMGMSNDYEIAIEEGATMIRVGSSIFK